MDHTWMDRTWKDWAPLPLRLIFGFGFVYHGYPKLFTADGRQMFVGMLTEIGVPAPGLTAWAVGFLEFLGGLALLAGAFVFLVSIPLIINMLVALVTVHLPHGFGFMNMVGMGPEGPIFGMPGYEIPLHYIAGLLALMLGGAGIYSIDRMRQQQSSRTPYTPAREERVAVGR